MTVVGDALVDRLLIRDAQVEGVVINRHGATRTARAPGSCCRPARTAARFSFAQESDPPMS
jgi:hypothetical protein